MHCIIMKCAGVEMENRQLTINTNQMDRALGIRSVDIQNRSVQDIYRHSKKNCEGMRHV